MNKEEFDSKLAASRGRVKAYSDGYRKGYDAGSKTGCATLPIVAIMVIMALLIGGCQQRCDCGWVTGSVYCEKDMSTGYTWAYLPEWGDVAEWASTIIGWGIYCYDDDGQRVDRQICSVDNIVAMLKDNFVFVSVDLSFCDIPAATPTP